MQAFRPLISFNSITNKVRGFSTLPVSVTSPNAARRCGRRSSEVIQDKTLADAEDQTSHSVQRYVAEVEDIQDRTPFRRDPTRRENSSR